MNTFDIEFEDEHENNSTVNARLADSGTKYAANTFTKGFFNADDDHYLEAEQSNSPQINKSGVADKESERKRKNRKAGPVKLEPMKQGEKVSVFKNFNRDNVDDLEEISYQPEKKQKKQPEPKREEKKKEEPAEHVINLPIPRTALVFDDEDDEEEQNQEGPSEAQFLQERGGEENVASSDFFSIPQNRALHPQFLHNSDDDEMIEVNGDIAEHTYVGPEYFSYESNHSLKKQLLSNIREGNKLRMELIRDKSGFCNIWPQFQLHFAENSHFLMSAKKTSTKPTSTFIITCRKGDFDEKSAYYLGKMKSNVLGDVLNVFGPGLNPSNAKEQNQIPRQLVATIVYASNIFQMGRPRQFSVYVKKPEIRYYSHFPQVRMYQEQIGLNTLNEYPENRNKIIVYQNKKPQWVESLGGYMLNFRGRVEKASIKNFILEENQIGPEIMLFGKVTQSKFNLDMSSPISPFIAFAVALSSFDTRIMCE